MMFSNDQVLGEVLREQNVHIVRMLAETFQGKSMKSLEGPSTLIIGFQGPNTIQLMVFAPENDII